MSAARAFGLGVEGLGFKVGGLLPPWVVVDEGPHEVYLMQELKYFESVSKYLKRDRSFEHSPQTLRS